MFHTTGVYITFDVEKFTFAAAAKRKLLRQSQKMQSAIFSSDTAAVTLTHAVHRKNNRYILACKQVPGKDGKNSASTKQKYERS